MDLARLRTLIREGAARTSATRELTYVPGPEGEWHAPADRAHAIAACLGATAIDGRAGPCLVVDRLYPSDASHGRERIGAAAVTRSALDLLEPAARSSVSLEIRRDDRPDTAGRLVFLDLETTGLSGGAGTYAFIVGCGHFDDDGFRTRQFFLSSYGGERALLGALADWLLDAAGLITYNGKTFDLPVMETRYLFHRLEMELSSLAHLDMVHTARRLWRRRTPRTPDDASSCRLTALETALLGVRRWHDVPGCEIPARYFEYVRSGNAEPLCAIFEHNRLDLLSLAALTARACRLAEGGAAQTDEAAECLGLGRLFERQGRTEEAGRCFERAVWLAERDADEGNAVLAEALRALAVRRRRERRFAAAADAWIRLLRVQQAEGAVEWETVEALAVHHEHRSRDLAAALEFARSGVDLSGRPILRRAAQHRLARITRKMRRDVLLPMG